MLLLQFDRFITKQTGHPYTVDHYLHGMMNQTFVFLLLGVCILFHVLNPNGSVIIEKTTIVFDKMWAIFER